MSSDIDKVKKALMASKLPKPKLKRSDFLSTGSTVLNMATSGRPDGGFVKGVYHLIVGDSSSGKTRLSMVVLAEASINPVFNKYRLIGDFPENGMFMDLVKNFGPKMARRLEPPVGTPDLPEYSITVDDFYQNASTAIKNGPCVYVLDSMDVLQVEENDPYGTLKAKKNSAGLRELTNLIAKNGSILIIISQTRQNIGFDAKFNPKTRSGGTALRFYARLELWWSIREKITVKVGSHTIQTGIKCRVKVAKNHINGWEGTIELPFLRQEGLDDIGGSIDYLLKWGYWKGTESRLSAPEFDDFTGSRERLVQLIEENSQETLLANCVASAWQALENRVRVQRKNRYA